MTFEEMRDSLERALEKCPTQSGPIVAIGHSKDFVDSDAPRRFLDYLKRREIAVTTFARLFRDRLKVPSGAMPNAIAN